MEVCNDYTQSSTEWPEAASGLPGALEKSEGRPEVVHTAFVRQPLTKPCLTMPVMSIYSLVPY